MKRNTMRLVRLGLITTVLGAIPIAVLTISTTSVGQESLRDEVQARMRTTAEATGQQLDTAFRGGITSTESAAGRPDVVNAIRVGDRSFLISALEAATATRTVLAAYVTAADGTLLAVVPAGSLTPAQVRGWAGEPDADHPTTISDAFASPLSARGLAATISSLTRTNSGDDAAGVLGLVFDLDVIPGYVEQVAKAQGVDLTVVDGSRALLAAPDLEPGLQHFDGPLVRRAAAGMAGLGRRKVDGETQLTAFAPISTLGWSVLAETPEHDAMAGARKIRDRALLLAALLALGLAVVVAVVLRSERRRQRAEAGWAHAHQEALEASRLKSEFLANMSHEIRTPLNGVLGMTTLLIETDLTTEQRDFAETSFRSGEALLTIINDVLDFSRIEAGKIDVEVVEFDLRALVEDVSRLLAASADTKGLELYCAVDPDIPTRVLGDPTRLRQILSNLAANAVKFTEAGEVVIRASVEHRDGDDIRARVAVTDTGIGIPADAQPRLFEAFTQADSSTTRRYGGSGLGLTICQRLVHLMGGGIDFHSVEGSGSSFWFEVPLGIGSQPAPTSATVPADHTGLRVLVVDDSEVGRSLLQRMLEAWGMDTTLAAGGQEALETLRVLEANGRPAELVLLDLNMPEIDGLGVTRAIRASHGNRPRIVLLTSSAQQGDARLGREAGIDGYLTKPVRRDDLEQVIALVMGSVDPPAELITRHVVREQRAEQEPRLLLAEDNPVNQKVAVLTLERLGYRVDVAENGEQAVAATEQHAYDAVLMDCQMPVMDGFEATRRIRAREGTGARVPIVALTSSATRADRQRCLDAGMDDHVAKPLRAEDLQEVLARMIATPQPGAHDAPRVDLGALRAIADSAGTEVVGTLVDTFADDAAVTLAALRDASYRGDLTAVAAAAHRLRGGASALGAVELAEHCATVERDAVAQQTAQAHAGIDALPERVDRTVAALRATAGRL